MRLFSGVLLVVLLLPTVLSLSSCQLRKGLLIQPQSLQSVTDLVLTAQQILANNTDQHPIIIRRSPGGSR
nr:MAG: hypothetical protein EDM05_29625 [Leptolyngbya sp. IPPAS B-1204]